VGLGCLFAAEIGYNRLGVCEHLNLSSELGAQSSDKLRRDFQTPLKRRPLPLFSVMRDKAIIQAILRREKAEPNAWCQLPPIKPNLTMYTFRRTDS
jgi:hypothetical protein